MLYRHRKELFSSELGTILLCTMYVNGYKLYAPLSTNVSDYMLSVMDQETDLGVLEESR